MKKKKETYSEIDRIIDTQSFVESIEETFGNIEDPRANDNQSYPLASLLVMLVGAILAGANNISHIHDYVKLKIDMFHRLLGIKQAPGYQVFWWLLVRLNPEELKKTFLRWIETLPTETKARIIAIDGKRLSGSSKQLVHLVSAWETGRGLLLGQVKSAEKSNEITAIPDLLEAIDVKGATVTIDAAGCQKKIVQMIDDRGGYYVIALKGNQSNLHGEAKNFFDQARAVGYEDAGCAVYKTVEKGHGRIEEREIVVSDDLGWLDLRKDWQGLTTLIEVTSRREIKGVQSEERRYFISNNPLNPKKAATLVRGHWSIENHLHWSMDVVFREDDCVVNIGHAPENFATLRRMAQALIQQDIGGCSGIAKRRRQAGWDDRYLIRLLGLLVQQSVKSF